MNKSAIAILILIVLIIIVISLYFIARYKKQAILTISSFFNNNHLNDNENQKESLIDRINDFFDENVFCVINY
ncbi:hypothetical protein COI44_09815 [Bacillus sp. AFS088145]|nr:hypothetical protein COI44_09815 [Bacillus sp. AFS088145]